MGLPHFMVWKSSGNLSPDRKQCIISSISRDPFDCRHRHATWSNIQRWTMGSKAPHADSFWPATDPKPKTFCFDRETYWWNLVNMSVSKAGSTNRMLYQWGRSNQFCEAINIYQPLRTWQASCSATATPLSAELRPMWNDLVSKSKSNMSVSLGFNQIGCGKKHHWALFDLTTKFWGSSLSKSKLETMHTLW